MFCIYVYVYNILTNKSDRIPDLNASPEVVIEMNNLLYSLHAKSNLFTKLHCNEKHFQTFQLSKYTLSVFGLFPTRYKVFVDETILKICFVNYY